jgi:hypothetical protein
MKNSPFLQKRLTILLVAALIAGMAFSMLPAPAIQAAAFSLFQPAVNYGTGLAPYDMAVGDFNRDGYLDLAVTRTSGSNGVSVFLNNASGGLSSQVIYNFGSNVRALAVADYNNDGSLDLAAASFSSDTIHILLNNGAGDFTIQATTYTVGDEPRTLKAADFNGDGKMDLVVGDRNSGMVGILLNDGTGAFLAEVQYASGSTPHSVAVGDFNGDGKPDVAVVNNGVGTIGVMLNNGSGGLLAPVTYTAGTSPINADVGDFNSDGKTDLVVASYSNHLVSVYLNDGTGSGAFLPRVTYATANNPWSATVADYNGDGKPDIATANSSGNNVTVLLNTGTGTFHPYLAFTAGANPIYSVAGDLNRDGRIDLMIGNQGSNNVSVLLNASPDCGNGDFLAQVNYNVGDRPDSVVTGDFNVDGKRDLAVANSDSNSVGVLLNNGSGGFAAQVSYTVGQYPSSVTMGDFNVDGKLDLATANEDSGSVSVLHGNGDGTFQAAVTFYVGTSPTSITVSDFNIDGKPDLVTANSGSNNVSVLLNNGADGFAVQVPYGAGTGPTAVRVGDFNLDGKADLAAANGGSNNVSVLRGNGDGTFQASVNYSVGTSPSSVTVGDFNLDGKPDLAVANSGSNTVGVLLNDGTGAFGAQVGYTVGTGPSFVTVGDFNGDSKPDLAAANSGSGNVSVLAGAGNGAFPASVNYTAGTSPSAIAVGDFNIDGKADLVATNAGSDNISVLFNQAFATSALVFHSLGSGAWNNAATWQCRVPGANDTVTIDAGHTVALSDNRSIDTITIDGTLTVSGSPTFQVGGDWSNNGTFTPASGTVSFNGTGAQTITGDTTFFNVLVGSASTVTTADDITLNGALTNNGWTSETKPISTTGPLSYGLGGVSLNVNTLGSLASLQVNRRDTDHPNGPAGHQTGRYWSLTPNTGASGFDVDLTLPTTFAPTGNDSVCRYTGSGTDWNCARTSNTSNTITRAGVTQFSDWTVLRLFPTTTTVATDVNPSAYGQTVTFTATVTAVSGVPTGTVTFRDGVTVLGSGTLNGSGVATFATNSLAVGTHPITASYEGAAMFVPSSGTLNGGQVVQRAQLTVTANNAGRYYGSANPTFTYAVTGFVLGENASVLSGSPSISSAATPTSPVGNYPITITQGSLSAANYTFAFVNGTLTVNPVTLTITASNASRAYGSANPTFTYTPTGFVNGENASVLSGSPSISSTATPASPIGNYPITITQGSLSATNYTFTFVNGTLTVQRAALTVTADDAEKNYGSANPTFTYTITGFVNGENESVVSGSPSISSTAVQASPVGDYPITITQGNLSAANYSFTFVSGTLTVNPAVLTVTADNATREFGSENPTFTYTVTGFVLGEDESVLSGSPQVTSTATPSSSIGTYPITVTQGSLSATNYTFTFVNGTLTITGNEIFLPIIAR